jgi:hypothetical protein
VPVRALFVDVPLFGVTEALLEPIAVLLDYVDVKVF